MGDLRQSALCERYAKGVPFLSALIFMPPPWLFPSHPEEYEDVESDIGGFFQELVTTISDVKFSPDGNLIVSRDYLTMKIWDPRVEV